MRRAFNFLEQPEPDEFRVRVGARLRAMRKAAGWTLADVETRCDRALTVSRLSNYETGDRLPGPGEAFILARLYGVAPAAILCLDDATDMDVTDAERALIEAFRSLPDEQQKAMAQSIRALADAYRPPAETGNGPAAPPLRQRKKPGDSA